jgi:glycosyltransferase involved in cell wall biosynthesis
MNYPKISIVTPSYNQAEFLELTIRSVLEQDYPNLEYIVIDGGSTDGSVDIIKKYSDRITYWVSENDKGQYDAINKGFSLTTGEIMGWINSSDIYYPWTFKIIAEIFENLKEVQWLTGMPTSLSLGNFPRGIKASKERNVYDIIRGDYKWIQQESVFWTRDIWNKSGGQLDCTVKYAEDFHLWLKFFEHSRLYNVSTILGGFRYHDIRRGGSDSASQYYSEAKDLFTKFKSNVTFKWKFRSFLVRIFFMNRKFPKKIIRKLNIFPWYQHYYISYNFFTNKWEIDTR